VRSAWRCRAHRQWKSSSRWSCAWILRKPTDRFLPSHGWFGPTQPGVSGSVLRLCRIRLCTACASGYFSMRWLGLPMPDLLLLSSR
jgi:hypothetical protein